MDLNTKFMVRGNLYFNQSFNIFSLLLKKSPNRLKLKLKMQLIKVFY